MPFGRPGHAEFGTYFIGYSRAPRIIETMLQNMFVGRPPGNYDRHARFQQRRYRKFVLCRLQRSLTVFPLKTSRTPEKAAHSPEPATASGPPADTGNAG